MTHRRFGLQVLTAGLLTLAALGCSSDKASDPVPAGYDFSSILADYSDHVATATYHDMDEKGQALVDAIVEFNADPTSQAKLDLAAAAWRGVREPWESSEAFLFGPAEFLSLDPALDSWPVDRQQLDAVLSSGLSLTPDNIRNGLGPTLRGFHTVEYLLFRNGAVRNAAAFTPREREYLESTARVLSEDAASLHEAWESGFADEFANAGKQGSRYTHQIDAVTEILDGIIGICDEVANGKIADPYDQQTIELVESQFSWNSLSDFADNIRSAQNAYMGGYHKGTDGTGLNEFVAARNAALDQKVRDEIAAAIASIGQIPQPLESNLSAATEIEAAQAAINQVATTLLSEVRPLITQ